MCGISGIYKLNGNVVSEESLRKMTDIIDYRGPDGFGYWYNDNRSLGFGHRRLSIIDLSNAGHQPMTYMGLAITFNGEIYNYLELKKELLNKGYKFFTETDTEVLLALYHQKGKACLRDLDGMFSFAIWDEERKELFCARDRFGEKPFYYYQDKDQFIFGSEIKQVLASGIKKEVNSEMLYHYCTGEHLLHPYDSKQTFYDQVFKLPPSHYLLVKDGKISTAEKYWTLDYEIRNENITFDQASETFNELLFKSINRRLRSDVPIGTSLSGGLDSTTIASYICRANPQSNLNTFTASFAGFEKDETKFIKILKEKYSNINDSYVSPTADELTTDLEKLLYHQDEPIISTGMYAQYRVMKLAKDNNVTVLLDGQGADEFLGGYNQYWPVRLREMFIHNDKSYITEKEIIKNQIGFEQNINGSLALMLKHPAIHRNFGMIKKILVKSKPIEFENPFHKDFFVLQKSSQESQVNWSDLNSVLNHSLFGELQNLLRYADRNSMAHSREVRLPFLYHKLVEFVFSLPSSYKMKDGWSKILLRKAQDAYLPVDICWRREKVGYATPQSYWLQNSKIVEYQNTQRSGLKKLNLFDNDFIDKVDNWKVLNLHHLLK